MAKAKKKVVKKKAKAYANKPEGKPVRQCPNCEKWYHPRLGACPACGAANPKAKGTAKKKKVGRPRKQVNSDDVIGIIPQKLAAQLIKAAGGVDEAKQAVQGVGEIAKYLE